MCHAYVVSMRKIERRADDRSTKKGGTVCGMDTWLYAFDRSDLYSDEGPLFGHQGLGEWEDDASYLRLWLLRWN